MTNRSFYDDLGLKPSATKAEIQAAFRKESKLHHPDQFMQEDESIRLMHEEKMKVASEAYHTLFDDEKRAQYDTYGEAQTRVKPQETYTEPHFSNDSPKSEKQNSARNPEGSRSQSNSYSRYPGETYAQRTASENFPKKRAYSPMDDGQDRAYKYASMYWDKLRKEQKDKHGLFLTKEQLGLLYSMQEAFLTDEDASWRVPGTSKESNAPAYTLSKKGNETTIFMNNEGQDTRRISYLTVEVNDATETTTLTYPEGAQTLQLLTFVTLMNIAKQMADKRKEGAEGRIEVNNEDRMVLDLFRKVSMGLDQEGQLFQEVQVADLSHRVELQRTHVIREDKALRASQEGRRYIFEVGDVGSRA